MKDLESLYRTSWEQAPESRQKRLYYGRLYAHLKDRIKPSGKILDVAGGPGLFLRYLEIRQADILDISDSGIRIASEFGYRTIKGNVEERFPFEPESYDSVTLFEVLEHLHRPNKTLAEIHNVLKPDGALYIGQPNMRPDGLIHVRRYYLKPLLDDLDKSGFKAEWVDFVPAYSMRDSIVSDIRKNKSFVRKLIQTVNLALSYLPFNARYAMAKAWPDRFALLFVIKAVKKPNFTRQ